MRRIFRLLLLLLFISSVELRAQSHDLISGFFPEFAITAPINDRISATGKVETQHGQLTNVGRAAAEFDYFHYRTDLQGFLNYRINPFWKGTAGYQYRFEGDGENSHRTIQQIAFVQRRVALRLAHRIRTDQTFEPNALLEARLRYRLSAEIPLEGQSVDVGEYYLVFSGEPILSVQDAEADIEQRMVGTVGKVISQGSKLELSLDYRTDRYLTDGFRHRIWLGVGWFVNL